MGLVLATAPSLLVAAEPARVWAYLALTLAAAAGVAAVREPPREVPAEQLSSSAAPAAPPVQRAMPPANEPPAGVAVAPSVPRTPRFGDVWTLRTPAAILLGLAAVVMGLRGLVPPASDGDAVAAIVVGLGGALLIFMAARYEKNMKALRTTVVGVTSLR